MSKPIPGESQQDFMDRCTQQVLDDGSADDGEEADAMCSTMWADAGMKSAAVPIRRAYGFLEVKAVNEEQRIIEGIATTPTPDRMGDVVMPLGAKFSLPFPLLYQHMSDKPIGEVFAAKAGKDGIAVKARIFKATQSKTLIERLDEAWESVKIGLLKGFSVGFRPIEQPVQIKGSFGLMYESYEIMELSICTIPAQAEAQISVVKSVFAAQMQRGVVRLDTATLRKAQKQLRPGVVYITK